MAPLRCAAKFEPYPSLDCAPRPSTLAQSKEKKGSNFAIWQHWDQAPCVHTLVSLLEARSTVEDAVRAEPSAFSYDEELVPKSALQVTVHTT